MFTIQHLSFGYPNKDVLQDICITFPKDTMTAIIGPNGCGKSTTLKHLSRALPTKGHITLGNIPLESIPSSDFAKSVSILSQIRDSMIDDFLVKDIVLMGRYPHKTRFGNYTEKDYAIAAKYMNKVGIEHLANEEIQHLSGGELQRVFIAKALTQEPSILLLDEPTNHLDLKHKMGLMNLLQEFKGTVITVLHDIKLAANYCDYIVLMNHGKIVAHGVPQKVLTPELLEPVFEVPFELVM